YYQYGFNVAYMTQRPLYSYKPQDATNPVPDLADGPAQITNGGKTVTIHIKKGIKFSPPVSREVTSADVKYALERGYNPNVAGSTSPTSPTSRAPPPRRRTPRRA